MSNIVIDGDTLRIEIKSGECWQDGWYAHSGFPRLVEVTKIVSGEHEPLIYFRRTFPNQSSGPESRCYLGYFLSNHIPYVPSEENLGGGAEFTDEALDQRDDEYRETQE